MTLVNSKSISPYLVKMFRELILHNLSFQSLFSSSVLDFVAVFSVDKHGERMVKVTS